ncbi:MAG: hypothetical protein Fues2KO_10320 [Fuerstiella sp.]
MKPLASVPALFLTTILLAAGCSTAPQTDYGSLDLVDVTGTVQLDGVAIPDAVIVFQDLESGLESYALTDANGEYRMQFDSVEHGVVPGEKQVIISTAMQIPGLTDGGTGDGEGGEGGEGEDGEGGSQQMRIERIPEAYRKDSPLKVTVSESSNRFNFDLAPDGSTTAPVAASDS